MIRRQKGSEKEAFETVSKEQLIELFKMSAQLMLTIDGLWFVGAEKIIGIDQTMKLDEGVWRQFGVLEANRMKKFLGMESVSTLEDVSKIVLLSPLWVSVGPQAEIDNGRCYLSVTNCLPQKARIKRDLSELPCKSMGTPILKDLLLRSILWKKVTIKRFLSNQKKEEGK